MRIAVGCDHRGLDAKQLVMELVESAGHIAEDYGSFNEDPVDYPDIAKVVAEAVVAGKVGLGILICNTGIGMSISANKVKGIRAALCCNTFMAGRARQHNDANILCLSTEMEPDLLASVVETFLAIDFEGGRHLRRVEKITALEG